MPNVQIPSMPKSEVSGIAIAEGNIIKSDGNNGFLAGEIFKTVRVAGSAEELNALAAYPISMKEMLQTWARISCNENTGEAQNANTEAQITARNCYYYNEAHDAIVCPNNSGPFTAFISTNTYAPNYVIDYMIDNRIIGNTGDDDGLVFVCGFMTDATGKFHTLSVWRDGDAETSAADPISSYEESSHGIRLSICYDVYTAWQKPRITTPGLNGGLVLSYSIEPKKTVWNNNYSRCQVTKASNQIIAKCSDANSDDLNYTISFALPSSKPDNWTQEQYDNIKYMLQNPTQIGFGTESNQSAFKVTGQTGSIGEAVVYDLTRYVKIRYNNNVKISEEPDHTVLVPGTFLYSQITKKLYYLKASGGYVNVILK